MILSTDTGHIPVMVDEVINALAPKDGGVYVDGTFGRGGYSRAILEAAAASVWGIDRDPGAVTFGAELSGHYGGRLTVLEGCFGDMQKLMNAAGIERVDGVALDLGVSSLQIDDPGRGFSFRADGPLDMRMGREGLSAADLVNHGAESDLADIIHHYGEERQARRIARAIVEARAESPILTTGQLADIVRGIVRKSKAGIDPATRTFMALRIHVNDELGELDRGLRAAEVLLKPGGRLVVVSFHSLEDRPVKEFLRLRSGGRGRGSRHLPDRPKENAPSFKLLKRSAIKPSQEESKSNPRSRSARLRAAIRTDAAVWPDPDCRAA
jgi:16S rRNA (cytosine1402-N4)-methyltransferase